MALAYAYGIIDSNYEIGASIKGINDAPVLMVPYLDIGIVISYPEHYSQCITHDVALDHVVRHEEVVEVLMDEFTVLPIRFNTVFKNAEDVLVMMKEHYRNFRNNLDRLHNKVEFGIKIIWSGDAIKEDIMSNLTINNNAAALSGHSPGTGFIKEKYEKFILRKKFKEEADRYITNVDSYLNRLAYENKLVKLKTDDLLLNAAYLVNRDKQEDFKDAFDQLRTDQSGLKYLFSGPWPPYNFIASALECPDVMNVFKPVGGTG